MNLKNSLYHRARHFVEREELARLKAENELPPGGDMPREILETLETVRNYLPEKAVLLDVGAHKGKFAQACNQFFDLAETICFEPNSELHAEIQQRMQGQNFALEQVALSDQVGKTTFFLHQDDSMNSTVAADKDLLRDEFPWDNPDHMTATEVPTTTLDRYVAEKGLAGKPLFLKLDTQGNELNILQHGTEALQSVEVLLTEFMFLNPYASDFGFPDFIRFMDHHNFYCAGALTIAKRPSRKVSAVDFLFVKQSSRD